jgi:hypothetical protein
MDDYDRKRAGQWLAKAKDVLNQEPVDITLHDVALASAYTAIAQVHATLAIAYNQPYQGAHPLS